jgi:hypothetical protein
MIWVRPALAAAFGAAALVVVSSQSLAQSYGPYGYTTPPYSYQPPPYSYAPPNYSYQPPGYTYTPPGQYRSQYRANYPDYFDAYAYPPSAYGDPRVERRMRRLFRDPIYNRFGNPRNPTDVWSSAPPYDSPGR